MSVASEITRLQNAKASLKTSINAKTDSSHQIANETLEDYAGFVDSISSGGGADLSEYFDTDLRNYTSNSRDTRYYLDTLFIKKIPNIIVPNNMTNIKYLCRGCLWEVIPKIIFNNNVTNIEYLFSGCKYCTNFDVSGFNIENVTTMQYIFSSCDMTSIDLSTFGTTKCSNFRNMFGSCNNLTSINLSNLISSGSSINAQQMFNSCSSLAHLDMRSFDFTKLSNTTNMFNSVPTNCEIIVADNTQKTWFSTKFSTLTNVKTIAEYNTMQ